MDSKPQHFSQTESSGMAGEMFSELTGTQSQLCDKHGAGTPREEVTRSRRLLEVVRLVPSSELLSQYSHKCQDVNMCAGL